MRRTIFALLTCGALLTASACGTAPGSPGSNAAPGGGSAAATTSAVGAACEALAKAYDKNMAPYAQALTTLTADPKAIAKAQQTLAAFATDVQEATKASTDSALQTAGKETAKLMQDKSADAKFFAAIKTPDDVSKAMGPTLTAWLAPVQSKCS
jgi:formiminotetrahydrofolate cyclodeaminase